MAKILVSFKEKEMDLYELVRAQGDQSNFMKDALKFYLATKNTSAPVAGTEAMNRKRKANNEEIEDILESL